MIPLLIKIGVCGLLYWIAAFVGVPQPWLRIIMVVLVIVAVLTVLSAFGIETGIPQLH